jgi:tetratricopeptide (TPR) repeat protein
LQLGHLHLQQGNRKEAVHHFAEAVKWHDPELVVETVITELQTGNHAAAIKLYTALAEEGIQSARLFTELGNCYFKSGNLEQAEHWFDRALALNAESDVVMYNLGLTRARLGSYQSALTLLTKYFETNSAAIDVAHVIGDIYFKMKQFPSAVSFYESVLTQQPSDAAVLLKLSDCYLHMGYTDSARLGYQRVLQLNPGNKEVQQRLDSLLSQAGNRQTV